MLFYIIRFCSIGEKINKIRNSCIKLIWRHAALASKFDKVIPLLIAIEHSSSHFASNQHLIALVRPEHGGHGRIWNEQIIHACGTSTVLIKTMQDRKTT